MNYSLNNKLKKIINFNRKIFNNLKFKEKKKIILCEFSNNSSNHLTFSYLLNYLKQKYGYRCCAYENLFQENFTKRIKFFFQNILDYKNFAIYRSFNVDDFILSKKTKMVKNLSNIQYQNIIKNIKEKKDILDIKIDDILIGDLIYDTFLKKFGLPTINIEDKKFLGLLKSSIENFYFWKLFFEKNNVKSLIISDTTYVDAIILRISVYNGISTYQCNWDNIHKIDKNNLYAYSKYKFYKNDFNKLEVNQKKRGLELAKKSIEKRFSANDFSEDRIMFYSNRSTFHKDFSKQNILKKNKNKKILIATHCFLDAPHGYGYKGNIFTDFYEWLSYLYDISKKTNYDWYIKNHPSSIPKTSEILNEFLKDKKEFNLIPSEISHSQLIKEGINCVLTVHGTIGWEYAYYQVPVINASINNPHILYSFNLHAENLKDYENMILNYEDYKIDYEKNDIYEFYFMHNLFSRSTWIFDDFLHVLKRIEGYKNLGTTKFYNYWIDNYNEKKHMKINKKLENFLLSDDYYIKNFDIFNNNPN